MSGAAAETAFDVFVSYAGEDRDTIARPLTDALRARGFSVWFDDYSIAAGDDLRHAITAGIRNARYGVLIISRSYLAKDWPRMEMLTLWAHEARIKRTVVIPVLHGLSIADVVAIDSAFDNRSMPSTDRGLDDVVGRIETVLQRGREANVAPIGNVAPAESTWRSLLRDFSTLPFEAGGVTPQLRAIWGGVKVALAYNGGIFAVILGDMIALAFNWQAAVAESRSWLRDLSVSAYLTLLITNLTLIYLWVRIVWSVRRRRFSIILAVSVLYAVAARIAAVPLGTIVVRRVFPSRVLMWHAYLSATAGSVAILLVFFLAKLLVKFAPRVVRQHVQGSTSQVAPSRARRLTRGRTRRGRASARRPSRLV